MRILDDFDDISLWRVVASNQVSGNVRQIDSEHGRALCLDYDFNGVSGYVGIQRDLAIDYPDNYQFSFDLRGDSPGNDLQFKLIDASGDNVWWVNRTSYPFPAQWSEVHYKRRHIDKAWGPGPEQILRHSAKLEFTIYNQIGGQGTVCFSRLRFMELPAMDETPLTVTIRPSTIPETSRSTLATDGNLAVAWQSVFKDGMNDVLTLDLGRVREFGGLTLVWDESRPAHVYRVELSEDGRRWAQGYRMTQGGGVDLIPLPESEARYIRILPEGGHPGSEYTLKKVSVEPLAFAATPNAFVKAVAEHLPRGWVPRGFSGEQPYWTIVGIDGGMEQGLLGEDGALEVGKGGFSVEPFVRIDNDWVTWADVHSKQSLQEGYLPIPRVTWEHPDFELTITGFASGSPEQSQLHARYRLNNRSDRKRSIELGLAVRPFQVNPPTQFLNITGGVSHIGGLDNDGRVVRVDGRSRVYARELADSWRVLTLAPGLRTDASMPLRAWNPDTDETGGERQDPNGLTTGLLLYALELVPGQSWENDLLIPMTGEMPFRQPSWDPEAIQQQVAEQWRQRLGHVQVDVPPQGQALVDTLRTATAHMLISRIGPRLQPGTRSYARSWIRDGAMISEGLLRMGHDDAVRDFLRWYAPYQFKDGMVPCCVDARGSDPVPENDSHGELIFTVAEYYRYTGDRLLLQEMWPHVNGAFEYMEKLRASERTEANRAINPAFYGLMPASISHEGYSAKPMHSYWDDFWALRGYKDVVNIAQWLGKEEMIPRAIAARDQFRNDLYQSLRMTMQAHAIDYLPGAVELGDFDPTSTTIALAPGGEQGFLPQVSLDTTFERYWLEFVQRRDGMREWKDYTPYEWRNVSAFIRLGWRQRAWEAMQYFLKDRAPPAWNQWAEVVTPTPRKPFFLGDLPHAWVASDFVRSALDMFAYDREIDRSLVLAAGIPEEWLNEGGVAIKGLRTPHGRLNYSLTRENDVVTLKVEEGLVLPRGGLVFPCPYPRIPAATRLNGRSIEWMDNELRIMQLPLELQMQW
ncbi:MAG: discoidin domain-containing protein [Xanthomonadaceae bacterium]|nr:discoidin domain-containing protein [Xanthomonadaceae bacterium]